MNDGTPPATQSALLVPVPEAEPIVAEWRAELDSAAPLGVPAHLTVLYPFVDPTELMEGDLQRLRAILATVHQFSFTLNEVRWFGDEVVWLAPEPDTGFRDLMQTVGKTWPELPPYGGVHDEVTPHLTIGDSGSRDGMQQAAADVAQHLPIHTVGSEMWLMAGSDQPGSWHVRNRFAFRE